MNTFMISALEMAKSAIRCGEIPVGAVIVRNNTIIAQRHNLKETLNQTAAHAEMLVIYDACANIGDWRLENCDLYVTLEPCPMCASAIIDARIRRLYFGAYDIKNGAAGGFFDLFQMRKSKTNVYGGIMETQCSSLLTNFEFQKNM